MNMENVSLQPDLTAGTIVVFHPKIKCSNKYVQKLLIKLFGYKYEYQLRRVRKFELKAEDYPIDCFDGDIQIEITKAGNGCL